MPAQIVDALRPLPPAQIEGAADHRQRQRRRQAHRDHVGVDELAEPDAGVEAFGREIDQLRVCGDLHLDLGIGFTEGCDQRLQQDGHHRARHGKAQQPSRPLSEVTRVLACGHELREGGLRAGEKSFTGFGQPDTAGRAPEEHCADARLEGTDRLADRRRSHRELRGGSAKAAVLGNAQERLYAVERTMPDCEAPLHDPSTLSRIVERRKRSYI